MSSRKKTGSTGLLGAVAGIFFVCCLFCACTSHKSVDESEALPFIAPPLDDAGVFPVSEVEAIKLATSLPVGTQATAPRQDMAFALEQSLNHVSSRPADHIALDRPGLRVTYGDMHRTLLRLQELLPRLKTEPELAAREFVWIRIGPDFGFTGYYEPTIPASRVRTARFSHPLYKAPPELRRVRRKGRLYHSRHDIDCKGVLRNRGLEIAWIEDPVDAFILQIQGSGRLVFPDGTVNYALYSAQNGRRYVSLGKVMKERGLLPEDGVSMQAVREQLAACSPEERQALLDTNPSYVFFKLGTEGSFGSMGRVLTPGVSVATDQRVLPNGLLTFMSVPVPDRRNGTRFFRGLMLPQDTGGAIRNNRVDLFLGNGPDAEFTAGRLDGTGAVFVLLARP